MKLSRIIIKITLIIAVCMLLFELTQKVLHHRWNVLYENYVKYAKCDDVDIIAVGTSELWCGIIPAVFYEEQGMKMFNLGHSYKSAITTYYELEYAFEKKEPKVVILDFAEFVYSSTLPQNAESAFRQAIYSIPDKKIKRKILNEVWKYDTREALLYEFPLLRFHNMWSSLSKEDFEKEYDYKSIECDYKLGWDSNGDLLIRPEGAGDKKTITKDRWDVEEDDWQLEGDKTLVEYYDKCIRLCQDNDAIIIAVFPPKPYVIEKQQKNWSEIEKFLNSRNVPILNYNTYDFYKKSELDYDSDYYDVTHLNYIGAMKWSHYVAEDVKRVIDEKNVQLVNYNYNNAFEDKFASWTKEFYNNYSGSVDK